MDVFAVGSKDLRRTPRQRSLKYIPGGLSASKPNRKHVLKSPSVLRGRHFRRVRKLILRAVVGAEACHRPAKAVEISPERGHSRVRGTKNLRCAPRFFAAAGRPLSLP